MGIKKIALPIFAVCAFAFVFSLASCTAKSSEKTAQEAVDALDTSFAPIDFDKAEGANEERQQ